MQLSNEEYISRSYILLRLGARMSGHNFWLLLLTWSCSQKEKNIIVSSGAEHELNFRGPYDIVNLGLLFNFKEEQSKAAITKNCRAVLFHAQARKGTERSGDGNNEDDNYEPKEKRAKAE